MSEHKTDDTDQCPHPNDSRVYEKNQATGEVMAVRCGNCGEHL